MGCYKNIIDSLRLCGNGDDPVDECGWVDCVCHYGERDSMCRQKVMFDAADAIEELLAAVPETAFWVDTQPHMDDSDYKKDGMSYYCSNCHHRAGKYKHRSYKFCPWCGAKIVPKEMAVRNED